MTALITTCVEAVMSTIITKKCSLCHEVKPDHEFYRDADKKTGLSSRCKTCRNRWYTTHREAVLQQKHDNYKKWRADPEWVARTNEDKRKNYHKNKRAAISTSLKCKYGISIEEYDSLLKLQCGRCAICGRAPDGKRLAVDHDHLTGKVRGLLCSQCNVGIGMLNHDISILQKAVLYLEMT